MGAAGFPTPPFPMTCDERAWLVACNPKTSPTLELGNLHIYFTLCTAGQRRPSLQNGAGLGKLYRHTLPSLWIGVQRTMGLSSGRYELNLWILTLVHRPYKQSIIGFNHNNIGFRSLLSSVLNWRYQNSCADIYTSSHIEVWEKCCSYCKRNIAKRVHPGHRKICLRKYK